MYSSLGFLRTVLVFVSGVSAVSYENDFGNIPEDHILFGSQGPPSHVDKRQATPDPTCVNSPTSRACWSDGFSIATDFDAKWPTTGRTRTYDWTITNTTCNPDGTHERICLLVNNQYPGPLLEADWGDMISVTVHNNLQDNGTAIHWHGIRQLNSVTMDGTNGLTECPLAPGQSKTYTFQATQFGTTWYHSHFSSQYGDGVLGPIVINGPAAANYDVDLGPFPVSDWFYTTAFQQDDLQFQALQSVQPGPPPDTLLINGTNGLNSGTYQVNRVSPGKSYRLRFVNTAVDASIRVSIDNHQMQVITQDLVPVRSVTTDSVVLGSGQRYDVVINASEAVGNYWLRATAEAGCNSTSLTGAQSILRYDGAPESDPTSSSTATAGGCSPPGPMTPWVPNNVGDVDAFQSQVQKLTVDLNVPNVTSNQQNIITWGINMTAIDVQWDTPTLEYVRTGNTSYPITQNLFELPTPGIWVYWIIQEVEFAGIGIYHPMHLHGHDFYILGSGYGTFNPQTDAAGLTYQNPPRRDTTMLPAHGWTVIAFPTDNPGAWLFHCHIAWHVGMGLGAQFLESKSQIQVPQQFEDQCNAWRQYDDTAYYKQDDSGL